MTERKGTTFQDARAQAERRFQAEERQRVRAAVQCLAHSQPDNPIGWLWLARGILRQQTSVERRRAEGAAATRRP